MGTYDHKQVLLDYANSNITAEMAVGHGLQHIGKLYEAQTAANLSRFELRNKVDTLEKLMSILQKEMAELTILVRQSVPQHNKKTSDNL